MNIIRLLIAGLTLLTISACTTESSQVPAESAGGTSTSGHAGHSQESRGTRSDVSR